MAFFQSASARGARKVVEQSDRRHIENPALTRYCLLAVMVTARRKYSVKAGRDLRPFERWCMPRAFVLPARPAGQPPPAGAVPMPEPELDHLRLRRRARRFGDHRRPHRSRSAHRRRLRDLRRGAVADLCRPDLQGHPAQGRGEIADPVPGLADRPGRGAGRPPPRSEVRAIEGGASAVAAITAPSAASAPTREPSGSMRCWCEPD